MKTKSKLLFFMFNIVISVFLLNTTVYAESEIYYEDTIIQQDTINISSYEPSTQEIEVKEYDFSSTPKEFPEETREPIVQLARPLWIIGPDDREYLTKMTTYPNSAICHIYARQYNNQPTKIGTGVMIGKNTVLTAAHVIYSWDKENCQEYEKWSSEITVTPACWGGLPIAPKNQPFGTADMKKMWVPTDYQTSGDHNYDWAVIKLDQNKGNETGFCDLEANDTSSELKNVEVVSKGYPNPNGDSIVQPYKATGKILNAYGLRFYTDMDVEAGQSGAPVFKRGSETDIIGIISGEDKWNKGRNVAAKINLSVKTAIYKIRAEAQQ